MNKIKTYRQKNKLLLTVVLVFALLVYGLALSPTISMYRENMLLEARLDSVKTAPARIARLTKKLDAYQTKLDRFGSGEINWQISLPQELARLCQLYGARLIQMPATTTEQQNGYSVETVVLKLQGGFKSLLTLLHQLENQKGIGHISSTRFTMEEDRRTRKTALVAYIYIQNIRKGENHEK